MFNPEPGNAMATVLSVWKVGSEGSLTYACPILILPVLTLATVEERLMG